VAFIILSLTIACYLIPKLLITTQIKPSKFLLKIDVYDYYSSEPIKELSFQMDVTTKENEKSIFQHLQGIMELQLLIYP